MPVQVISNFHKDPIKMKQAMLQTMLNMVFFGTKGQVTPESMVQSGQNLNLSEILCLSKLSASSITLKSSRLCSGQVRIWRFSKRESNSESQ